MSNLYWKLLLKKDVRDLIILKINDIQNFLTWSDINILVNVADLDLSRMNYDYAIKQQKISEFAAKLSVDLFRDFEYYRQFSFDGQDTNEYVDGLVNLGCVCVDGKWKCTDRPSEDKVQENVFRYCFDRLIVDEIRNKSKPCVFCDAYVCDSDDKCYACGKSVDEINQYKNEIIYQNKTKLLDENDAGIIYDNDPRSVRGAEENGFGNSEDEERNKFSESKINDEQRDPRDIMSESRSNNGEYDTQNKVANIGPHGQGSSSFGWICSSCTFNNKLYYTHCDACLGARYKELANNNAKKWNIDDNGPGCDTGDNDDVPVVTRETWKCTKCGCDNLCDRYICGKCSEYVPFFDKWVCERCSFFNDPVSPCCAVCTVRNVHLKKCDKCKKNDVNRDVDRRRVCSECTDACSRGAKSKEMTELTASGSADDDDGREWLCYKIKKCRTCNNKVDITVEGWICKRCIANKYYCNNRRCGAINSSRMQHCSKCYLKKGCNVTATNQVEVFAGGKYVKMWQCTHCGVFNGTVVNKCTECKNSKCAPSDKMCTNAKCKWVNKVMATKCDKCSDDLTKGVNK